MPTNTSQDAEKLPADSSTAAPIAAADDPKRLIAEAIANHRRRSGEGSAETPKTARNGPGAWPLIAGVIYPATVIVIEATTRTCARHLFDPMPTNWHVAMLAMVPAINLIGWWALQRGLRIDPRWLITGFGFALGVSSFYALVFLPVLPLAIVAVLIGVGLLPLGPYFATAASLRLIKEARAQQRLHDRSRWPVIAGIGAAVVAVIGLDLPQAATRHGLKLATSSDTAERERGINFLRSFGDHDLLRRIGHGGLHRPVGPLGFLADVDEMLIGGQGRSRLRVPHVVAREVYYRVTGQALTTQPSMRASPADDRVFDADLGGTQVGGTVPGLTLASSRIDGTISANDAVAYVEWIFEVQNATAAMQEARMTLALPPGGVVSRVTLWVNGVEEEAAFAGRGQVRAAYERVVRKSQDPFLVTTNGADRVLAQAFPVPPRGGIMKFKIGITAPLELEGRTGSRLVLPSIVDRNFDVESSTKHSVWIDSAQPLTTATAGLSTSTQSKGTRIAGEISDSELSRLRPVIQAARDPERVLVYARNPETGAAIQEIGPARVTGEGELILVVDGSVGTRPHVQPILAALDVLPSGMRVGLTVARDGGAVIGPEPWSALLKAKFRSVLESETYLGGTDNVPSLVNAFTRLSGSPDSGVVWIHGPQPVLFRESRARLEQAFARIGRTPTVSLYALAPGPNVIVGDGPWAALAHDIPNSGDVTRDLRRALARLSGVEAVPMIRRRLASGAEYSVEPQLPVPQARLGQSADHIVRLAAHDEILSLLRQRKVQLRAQAVEIAASHRLVTPVSGAVVLETKQQYQEAGLTQGMKGQAGNVPTVPEPHEWALILLSAFAFAWMLWTRRGLSAASRTGAG